MTFGKTPDRRLLDLDRDLPTTGEDVRALREARQQTRGWFHLTAEEIVAMFPADALLRRSPAPPNRRPFSLE